jgi:hypothetical protein
MPAELLSRQATADMIVAAVGLRYGKQLLGIRALLEAGCRVLAFDLGGAFDEEPLADYDETMARHVQELAGLWPDRFAVADHIGDDRVGETLIDDPDGAARILSLTDDRFGRAACVYIGQWAQVVDNQVGADFINLLAARGGGEFIATEADNPFADHTLRWIAHWSGLRHGEGVVCSTLREPEGARGTRTAPLVGRVTAQEMLTEAGWSPPLTVDAADAVAARRIADGSDLLAGRRWRYLGTGDVDSGCVAIGDAKAMELASEAEPGLESSLAGETDFAFRANYVVYRQPGGDWPYGVAVTPADDGPVEAVRIETDLGAASDFPDAYGQAARIEVPTGRLLISDPAYFGSPYPPPDTRALTVPPGTWVVDRMFHEGDLECVRLRWESSDADPGSLESS